MITISDASVPYSRRGFLRVGSLGLGGLGLSQLLATKAQASPARSSVTGKSVIFLFMHGGPSQYETWDPKMTAPAEIRSQTGEIPTSIPGITFGSTFTKLASLADKLAIVRSYVPGDANHDAKPITHRETLNANLGAYYAKVYGSNHPTTGVPTNISLYPQAVLTGAQPPVTTLGNFNATGPLGPSFTPFMPGGTGDLQRNMNLNVPAQRLGDRRTLLSQLDSLRRNLDNNGIMESLDRYQEQALQVIVRGVADAFDLKKEDPRLLARYDTAPLVNVESIPRLTNYKLYVDYCRGLGKQLLLARRLCEAGCGFVTVNTSFVWDMHANGDNAPCKQGMSFLGTPFDHAVSAFIEDLEARGLSDKILLVACGEMGRTPRVNNLGGRDHWGELGPLLFYGGGLKMGQVIGRSARDGGRPASEPVQLRHLVATVMHTLFDVGEVRLLTGLSGEVGRLITQGEPIRQLFE